MEQTVSWKLWIPLGLSNKVISGCHDATASAHGGVAKTIDKVRILYYWPGMVRQIREYVSKCEICKVNKAPNYTLRPPMGRLYPTERAFQRLYIDLLGPYPRSKKGNTSLLIVLDQFSKYVLLKPLRLARSNQIIDFLRSGVFNIYGVPETILSDNGAQFVSKEFASCLKVYGVRHIFTATHAPQADALERVNRSILAAIRSYIGKDQRDWDNNISTIASALRNSTHCSTKFSPHFLVFGSHRIEHASAYPLLRQLECLKDPEMEVIPKNVARQLISDEVDRNIKLAHKNLEKTYNMRSRPTDFQPGQEVYRRNFAQSDFKNNFNAKLASKFLKCRILR